MRPYLPAWFPVANLLLVLVSGALAQLRSVSFRTNFIFIFVFGFQLALVPLSTERHPVAGALVTMLIYLETFVLVPKWNRRLEGNSNILHLEDIGRKSSLNDDEDCEGTHP